MTRHTLIRWLGLDARPAPHRERLLAALGGLLGTLVTAVASHALLPEAAFWLTAAMGATAVLLFAVPHGTLSQPWALFGGHLLSALVGVSCARWVPDPLLAASLAVGVSIGAMHYARCLHPPGGATALIAVVGGPQVHSLGFGYLLCPVLLNTSLMFAAAILFNAPFPWRRYPAGWSHSAPAPTGQREQDTLAHRDIRHAIKQLGLVVDVSEKDLHRLLNLALAHASQQRLSPQQIRLGACYSNGSQGQDWSVRQVIDESDRSRPLKDLLIYKTVAGDGSYSTGSCNRDAFARWARYEVALESGQWVRKEPEED